MARGKKEVSGKEEKKPTARKPRATTAGRKKPQAKKATAAASSNKRKKKEETEALSEAVTTVATELVAAETASAGMNGNLIPLNQRAKDVQRQIQSAGGKAKAEKDRKRKAIREFLNDFLDADASPALQAKMQVLGVDAGDMSNYAAMCMSLFSKAVNHSDINAFRTIMEYAGRAPLQEMRENEAIAKMSQVMMIAQQATNQDKDDNADDDLDVVFYIPDNGRAIITDDEPVAAAVTDG